MSAERWRSTYLAVAVALLALSLSAESCQNTTGALTLGSAAITITNHVSAVNVAAGDIRRATASCQAGEVMLSGGYGITTPAYYGSLDQSMPLNRYFVYEDYPSSSTTWTASVLNRATGTEAGDILLSAHVECAAGLSGAPTISNAVGAIHDWVTASCSSVGLTGGGYKITHIRNNKAVVTIVASVGSIGNSGLVLQLHLPEAARFFHGSWQTSAMHHAGGRIADFPR